MHNYTMYALVRFVEDNILYVCRTSQMKGNHAKWSDGLLYEAERIISSANRKMLTDFCYNMSNKLPVIVLNRKDIDTYNKRSNTLFNIPSIQPSINIVDSDFVLLNPNVPSSCRMFDDVNEKYQFLDIISRKTSEERPYGIVRSNDLAVPESPSVQESPSVEEEASEVEDPFSTDEDPSYVPSDSSESVNECRTFKDSTKESLSNIGDDLVSNISNQHGPSVLGIYSLNDMEENDPSNLDADVPDYTSNNDIEEHEPSNMISDFFPEENTASRAASNVENSTKKRKTKRHFCIYCKKLVTKLPKHLELHRDIMEVSKALSVPKGSKERRALLNELQKKGDFEYNAEHANELITVRRVNSQKSIPCPYCKGYYSSKNLRNHIRLICKPDKKRNTRNLTQLSRSLQPRILNIANDMLKFSVIPKLRDDDISDIIRHDELIIICGNTWCTKYSSSSHHHKMIRSRLRHLGNILKVIKKINHGITDLSSVFDPTYFDDVVKTIQEMAGLNSRRGEYRAPSSATNSCTLLLQTAEMCKFEAIKKGDEEKEKMIDKFIFLLEKSMNPLITKIAIENRTQRQRQKVVTLPKTENVQQLFVFSCNKIKKYIKELTHNFDRDTWENLAKTVLVAIMIFNRKRPGEIERAQLLDYKNCEVLDQESRGFLEEHEQNLATVFARFTIRGKLNRTVPVVVSELMRCGIDTILKFRCEAGIPIDNKYIFGRQSSSGETDATFSANLALKELKYEVPNAENITATKLRKHLATVSNQLNLNEGRVNTVANFMGHHKSIHQQIYVQRPILSDVVGVTPILNRAIGVESDQAHVIEGAEFNYRLTDILPTILEETDLNGRTSNGLSNKTESTGYALSNSSSISEETELNGSVPRPQKRKSEYSETNYYENIKRTKIMGGTRPPRRTWTTPEKNKMRHVFQEEISQKEVPTLPECTQALMNHSILRGRTPKQIQMWVLCESKRNEDKYQGRKNRWTTPERKACREHFKDYYKTQKYPTILELDEAIRTVPELQHRTPRKLKSHLQHDLQYMLRSSF